MPVGKAGILEEFAMKADTYRYQKNRRAASSGIVPLGAGVERLREMGKYVTLT